MPAHLNRKRKANRELKVQDMPPLLTAQTTTAVEECDLRFTQGKLRSNWRMKN
jgi:hypothetical protein